MAGDAHANPQSATGAPEGRPLLDVSAALWAALVSAIVFSVLCCVLLPALSDDVAAGVLRLFAAPWFGPEVLVASAAATGTALIAGAATMAFAGFALSVLLAITIHRFGLLVGIVGGALYGLVVYVAFVDLAALAWQSFAALAGMPFVLVCVLFGAVSGAVYEWLEVEEFELDGETS